MTSNEIDRRAYVAGRIVETLDAISSLMATVHRLERRGFDTTDARDRLRRLENELSAWKSTETAIHGRQADATQKVRISIA